MRPGKPTVFFSHSSRDRDVVQRLQRFLAERTGRAVELFVSSDGQSIPGGHNWSARVHEALSGAQLMFVLVSPQSLDSRWIYFEAGYGYRGEIAVVPLGILGVALDRIPPPLNALQGFEIRSPDGLASVIDRINRTFDFAFDTRVSADEYAQVFADAAGGDAPGLDAVVAISLKFDIPALDAGGDAYEEQTRARLEVVAAALRAHGIPPALGRDHYRGWGAGFEVSVSRDKLEADVDPSAYPGFAAALADAAVALGAEPEALAELSVRLVRETYVRTTLRLRDSVMLARAGLVIVGERKFVYEGTQFFLGDWLSSDSDGSHARYLEVRTTVANAASVPLLALVARVAEAGLLGPAAGRAR